jgi:hypothetical protein
MILMQKSCTGEKMVLSIDVYTFSTHTIEVALLVLFACVSFVKV